ncbi:MAG: hypothetical protein AAFP19_19310, partial [Bacteroidota bacterium]
LESFDDAVSNCDETPDWTMVLNDAQETTEEFNGQTPIYDLGYIDSPVEMVSDNEVEEEEKPRKTRKERKRERFSTKQKFDGEEIAAPTIIYIEN